jgi:hypothetical protein
VLPFVLRIARVDRASLEEARHYTLLLYISCETLAFFVLSILKYVIHYFTSPATSLLKKHIQTCRAVALFSHYVGHVSLGRQASLRDDPSSDACAERRSAARREAPEGFSSVTI